MRKGQGSLEYLLILAAILAIAVVIILVANSMLATPEDANVVNQDKYNFAVQGMDIVNYDKPFDPDEPKGLPQLIIVQEEEYALGGACELVEAKVVGQITDEFGVVHNVCINEAEKEYYVEDICEESAPGECEVGDWSSDLGCFTDVIALEGNACGYIGQCITGSCVEPNPDIDTIRLDMRQLFNLDGMWRYGHTEEDAIREDSIWPGGNIANPAWGNDPPVGSDEITYIEIRVSENDVGYDNAQLFCSGTMNGLMGTSYNSPNLCSGTQTYDVTETKQVYFYMRITGIDAGTDILDNTESDPTWIRPV